MSDPTMIHENGAAFYEQYASTATTTTIIIHHRPLAIPLCWVHQGTFEVFYSAATVYILALKLLVPHSNIIIVRWANRFTVNL
jgi:hypothetical protein